MGQAEREWRWVVSVCQLGASRLKIGDTEEKRGKVDKQGKRVESGPHRHSRVNRDSAAPG